MARKSWKKWWREKGIATIENDWRRGNGIETDDCRGKPNSHSVRDQQWGQDKWCRDSRVQWKFRTTTCCKMGNEYSCSIDGDAKVLGNQCCVLLHYDHIAGCRFVNLLQYNNSLEYLCFAAISLGVTSELGIWLGTIAISAANFLGVFIAVALIDRAGRRVLLSISSIMIVISSVLVSVSIIMNESGSNIMWSYAALGGLVLFVVGFEVGIGPCVWLLVGELPPMRYRGVIVSVAVGFNWLSHLAIAQWSPIILESDFKMFPFAIATFLALIFIHRFLPETNGKTAKEIQKALNNLWIVVYQMEYWLSWVQRWAWYICVFSCTSTYYKRMN